MIIVALVHIPDDNAPLEPPQEEDLKQMVSWAIMKTVERANPYRADAFDVEPDISMAVKPVIPRGETT